MCVWGQTLGLLCQNYSHAMPLGNEKYKKHRYVQANWELGQNRSRS